MRCISPEVAAWLTFILVIVVIVIVPMIVPDLLGL